MSADEWFVALRVVEAALNCDHEWSMESHLYTLLATVDRRSAESTTKTRL